MQFKVDTRLVIAEIGIESIDNRVQLSDHVGASGAGGIDADSDIFEGDANEPLGHVRGNFDVSGEDVP